MKVTTATLHQSSFTGKLNSSDFKNWWNTQKELFQGKSVEIKIKSVKSDCQEIIEQVESKQLLMDFGPENK